MTAVVSMSASPIVWMFSGQGAQYFQMGRVLYESHPVFRRRLLALDAVAAPFVGESVVEVIYDPARRVGQPFDDMLLSHPALFMVQLAMAETLRAEGLPLPDMLLGASLGEFVAAAVAGVFEPEVLLRDLVQHARLFEAHCTGGGMLVVLDAFVQGHPVFAPGIELAGISFERCFAVSGPRAALTAAISRLQAIDVPHQLLPVGVGFHSSQVDVVANHFKRMIAGRSPGRPNVPIVSCAMASPGQPMPEAYAPEYWWQVVRRPIDFRGALLGLHGRYPQARYIDLGPSGTQANFARYNLPPSEHERVFSIMSPFGDEPQRIAHLREVLSPRAVIARST